MNRANRAFRNVSVSLVSGNFEDHRRPAGLAFGHDLHVSDKSCVRNAATGEIRSEMISISWKRSICCSFSLPSATKLQSTCRRKRGSLWHPHPVFPLRLCLISRLLKQQGQAPEPSVSSDPGGIIIQLQPSSSPLHQNPELPVKRLVEFVRRRPTTA